MAIGNGSQTLAHAWEQQDRYKKRVREEGKTTGVSMKEHERKSPDGQSLTNQNKILINTIWYYLTRYRKSTMKFN